MHQGTAEVTELYLNGRGAARLRCDPGLVPAAGQYLLATASDAPQAALATPLFSAGPAKGGFFAAPPLPGDWQPGTQLHIRGPLGKGFQLPQAARFVGLAVMGASPARLLALTETILAQNAAIVLLADSPPPDLPAAIEISPLASLADTLRWADLLLVDTPRTNLAAVLKEIGGAAYSGAAQILVDTPVPCGGMGECGLCAVSLRKGHKLACKDGPVFDLKTLLA